MGGLLRGTLSLKLKSKPRLGEAQTPYILIPDSLLVLSPLVSISGSFLTPHALRAYWRTGARNILTVTLHVMWLLNDVAL